MHISRESDGGSSSLLPQPQSVPALGVTLPLGILAQRAMWGYSLRIYFPHHIVFIQAVCGPVDCRRSGFLSLSP